MAANIQYIFTSMSPWAYIGHAVFMEIVERYEASIRYMPVKLPVVFEQTGGVPLPKRPLSRQSYRLVELQRWRDVRNVALDLHPTFWPFDPSLLDRTIIAIVELGYDPGTFTLNTMQAAWSENRNLAERDEIFDILNACGLPASECLEKADQNEIMVIYNQNTQEAIDLGGFGSPTYVLNGEVFWGQDRLELLDVTLKAEREPYLVLS